MAIDELRYVVRSGLRRMLPLLLIATATVLLAMPDLLGLSFLKVRLVALALVSLGLITLMFEYLQGSAEARYGRPRSFRDEEMDRMVYELRNVTERLQLGGNDPDVSRKISELKELVIKNAGQHPQFTDAEKASLVDTIRKQIGNTLSDEFLRSLDEKYASVAIEKSRFESLIRDFQLLRQRLLEEVRALQRRANLNLAIGSFTTLLAGAALVYVVLRAAPDFHSTPSVVAYYVPRVTFVVFIEVFAFFFLRLYKVSLDDIKFYQNELTNIESKLIALRAALADTKQSGLGKILEGLAATERNFVLKKGETTVDLERRKLDVTEGHAVFDQAANILQKLKPKD